MPHHRDFLRRPPSLQVSLLTATPTPFLQGCPNAVTKPPDLGEVPGSWVGALVREKAGHFPLCRVRALSRPCLLRAGECLLMRV